MITRPTFVLVTAAKDEEQFIEETIRSVVSQSVLPSEWVIVDDGSTDGTAQLIERYANEHHWMHLIHKPRGMRNVGVANLSALRYGLQRVHTQSYDYLCIVDADVILPRRYYEEVLAYMGTNPKIGIAAGQVLDRLANGALARMREEPEMTSGAVKCYRKECYEDIGGLPDGVGWDGMDCWLAMMHGWTTQTLPDVNVRVIHLRPMGSSQVSVYHGRVRRGRAMHFLGSHPLWVLGSAIYHSIDRPYIVGSCCMVYGWTKAAVTRSPRHPNSALVQFLRRWQLRKLWRFILRAE